MAVYFGLCKFEQWVYGRKVEVYSDHRPLQWLNSLSRHNPRLARWNLTIQRFNISTTYIPGKFQIADGLTRLHE